MRYLVLALFYALTFVALPAQASCIANPAPVKKQIGYCCTGRGQTVMDDNKLNIIVCACNTTPNCVGTADLVWKAMAVNTITNGTVACPADYLLNGFSKGVPICFKPATW